LGWEGPIVPFDSANVNARAYTAGTRDTTLEMQYYNSRGVSVDQYWSPFLSKRDSTGVLFKVNVVDLMKNGLFDPAVHGPLAVRGDSTASAGVLSWNASLVVLQRETVSVAGGSFWSGVAYFPRNLISAGTLIKYRFFTENSSFGGWESNIADRIFSLPGTDSTLAWQFFNNRVTPTGVEERSPLAPAETRLDQNFPNPFNPRTVVSYQLSALSDVRLTVYDVLGREVAVLVNERKGPGRYSVQFDAGGAASGEYVCRLTAGGSVQSRKMLLVK
jgi:hypothetical protein